MNPIDPKKCKANDRVDVRTSTGLWYRIHVRKVPVVGDDGMIGDVRIRLGTLVEETTRRMMAADHRHYIGSDELVLRGTLKFRAGPSGNTMVSGTIVELTLNGDTTKLHEAPAKS